MIRSVLHKILSGSMLILYGFLMMSLTAAQVESAAEGQVRSIRDVYVSLDLKNVTIAEFFTEVERQTGYSFVFNPSDLSGLQTISVKETDKSLADVLEKISSDHRLKFRQVNKNISVKPIDAVNPEEKSGVEVILQTRTVTGTVIEQTTSDGLPGVNIIEKGTTNGTITDVDGNFRITVADNAVLVISSVGYVSQELSVQDRSVIDVIMVQDLTALEEVVVTAMGIERDKKSLGYAVSSLSSQEINAAGNTVNPLISLYGKASGVGITSGVAGPTGNVDIRIRGAAGLESSANTRPLFVVDGIPIYDEGTSMASRGYDPLNSFDYGSGINDINPEDIESIEILKGAKASVLYGGEGANGVVLITTKKGKKSRGLGVNVNWQHNVLDPYSFIDFQNEYGSGVNEYDEVYTELNGQQVREIVKSRFNFGPKFDNETPIMFLDSIVRPYQAYPDNFIDLFRNGRTDNFTVAISGASDKGNMRAAYTRYGFNGILDNFYQNKDVLSFTGKMAASDFATFELNSNLFNIKTNNRYPNIGSMVAWGINRDYPFDAIKDMYKNEDGSKFDSEGLGWPGQFAPSYLMDILWEQYENNDTDEKFHYIGSLRATLNFTDWLYLVTQVGIDYTDTDFTTRNPLIRFEPQNAGGRYAYRRNNIMVQNYRGFLNFDKNIGDFGVMAFIGGEYRKDEFTNIGVSSFGDFNYPNFWSIDNTSDWPDWGNRGRVRSHNYGSKVLYAAMASATVSWKDQVYVELQGRNDWSSTLDPDNNSYFYPGIAANWNFTNTYDIPWLDFGKLRMAWADVGRPAPGYYYAYQSYSTGRINNSDAYTVNGPGSLFSGDIKPERKREYEIGFDGRMLDNRLEANLSFYHNNVYDQIMGVNLSAVTGASEIKINAGNVANWGYEVFLKGAALSTPNYRWEIAFTAAIQRSKVKELYPGITRQTLGGIGNSVIVTADEGEPYGELLMYDYMTDGQGNRVVNQNGNDYVLDKEEFVRQGNIADRVFGGVMSDFFWKNFNVHVGVDYKFGGSLFSYSNYYLLGMGIVKESLKYRDEEHGGLAYYIDDATGATVPWQHDQAAPPEARDGLVYHDGLILPGVVRSGGTEENPVYTENEKIIPAVDYYSTAYIRDMSTDFQPDNLYKNQYIKLRELAIGYNLPAKFVEKIKLQKLTVSFLARDLFYFYKSIPNIDSESALGSGSFTEYSFFPSVRSYGIGINVSF